MLPVGALGAWLLLLSGCSALGRGVPAREAKQPIPVAASDRVAMQSPAPETPAAAPVPSAGSIPLPSPVAVKKYRALMAGQAKSGPPPLQAPTTQPLPAQAPPPQAQAPPPQALPLAVVPPPQALPLAVVPPLDALGLKTPPDLSRSRLIPDTATPPKAAENDEELPLPPAPALPPLPVTGNDAGVQTTGASTVKPDSRVIPLEVEHEDQAPLDPQIGPVACSTCGRGLLASEPYFMSGEGRPTCASCGGSTCRPGHKGCNHIEGHTMVGRMFGAFYDCLFCPDPCYQPMWIPEANAAFFEDYARPQTLTRIRDDIGIDMVLPDRDEFFWAQGNGKGLGPGLPTYTPHPHMAAATTLAHHFVTPPGRPAGLTGPVVSGRIFGRPPSLGPLPTHHTAATHHAAATTTGTGTGKLKAVTSLNYNQLSFYQEVASARASFFIEMPYVYMQPVAIPSTAGFGDMNLGTKSLLLDCELLQVTLQFRTYIPIGNSKTGLGTGHVSLEPSLLSSLRLTPTSYLQGQLSEWIPIGGDPDYASSMMHYHFSLNQVLYRLTPDSPLIGTMEFNGWSFQGGGYTDPYLGFRNSSGGTYASVGPGLRMVLGNSIDFGLGTAFAVTNPHWADTLYRLEFRVRF